MPSDGTTDTDKNVCWELLTDLPSDWGYRHVKWSEEYYGPAVHHAFEQDNGEAITVALSEGLHIMTCPRGSWQVTVGRGDPECFEAEGEAFEHAVEKANTLSNEQ